MGWRPCGDTGGRGDPFGRSRTNVSSHACSLAFGGAGDTLASSSSAPTSSSEKRR